MTTNQTLKEKQPSVASSGFPTPDSSSPSSPYLSPLHPPPPPSPTHQQTLIVLGAIYPLTILLGCMFSLISPTGQSRNYFSQKHNVFNLLFVKTGWFWTTVAFAIHLTRIRTPNTANHNPRIRALIRYGMATVFWIFITQWFFGAPIMDRAFTLTGGVCTQNSDGKYTSASSSLEPKEFFTASACKIAGGAWAGGHDLSGHVFMLAHASMFLWAEMMPKILDTSQHSATRDDEWMGVHWFLWAVLGMWWWMMLMTSVYFHTFQEKITGWLVSVIEWGLIYAYAIPRNEQVRKTIGVPTV